jgi:hypothetical protein
VHQRTWAFSRWKQTPAHNIMNLEFTCPRIQCQHICSGKLCSWRYFLFPCCICMWKWSLAWQWNDGRLRVIYICFKIFPWICFGQSVETVLNPSTDGFLVIYSYSTNFLCKELCFFQTFLMPTVTINLNVWLWNLLVIKVAGLIQQYFI